MDSALFALQGLGLQPDVKILNVILPLGISFYTFQTLAYTIDVYRGTVKAETNFFNFSKTVARYFENMISQFIA